MKVHPNVSMTKSGRHTIVFVVPDKLYRICCCKNIACFSFGYANVFLPCFFTCITLLVALSMPFSPCYHVTIYHVHHVTIYLVLPSRVHQGRQGVGWGLVGRVLPGPPVLHGLSNHQGKNQRKCPEKLLSPMQVWLILPYLSALFRV